ncbi:DUF5615 family PIN-like protein [Halorubraceae archaeon YAN]|nr:DUF5615 family PIN-like protein [Halorubraceae archaeon YAN]
MTDSPRQQHRFVVDAMCGKLARYLRMCGYDTVSVHDEGLEADKEIQQFATETGRTLLTRDRSLATDEQYSVVLLTDRGVLGQLQTLREHNTVLSLPETPAVCSVCNGTVGPYERIERPKHAPADLPLWECQDCEQVFWKGSHWDNVKQRLEKLERRASEF